MPHAPSIPAIDRIEVSYGGRKVGTLAATRDDLFPFEYADSWLADGFSISPLSLPLEKKVFIPKRNSSEGLFGVFADSLPDGWGRVLVDRLLRSHHIDPFRINSLMRLAIVGTSGMGALEYKPSWDLHPHVNNNQDLDYLAEECTRVLEHEKIRDLDTLFALGGSSGGARPKILTHVEGEDWLIKFPSSFDPQNIGSQEYAYAMCAKDCGIEMPEVKLFPSSLHCGYFGAKRFDRDDAGHKTHMVSAAGLLETSHRFPNLDYLDLMSLLLGLSNSYAELKKLFKLMCFNVFAHNRDDHSKNFSFLFSESSQVWTLSPAYDLTYSASMGGEHATTVSGNGRDPGIEDVLAVAHSMGVSQSWARTTAEDIKERTHQLLVAENLVS